jgi:hypothetical protein
LDPGRDRRTPESRTPYVLLLTGVFGVGLALWRVLSASRLGVEILLGVSVGAVVFAVWLFVRQRR